jgi:hypothetical protein
LPLFCEDAAVKKTMWIAALLLGLGGCAGSPHDIARRHDALRDYKGADAGFVVVSEGAERGGHFDASGVTFQLVGSEDLVDFAFATRGLMFTTPQHDFESGSVIGKVQPKRLPPGEYQAVAVHGEQFINNGSYRRALAPGLRFTVKAGETIYLGRYIIRESRFNPLLSISENQAEDMALAAAMLRDMPADSVRSAVPPPGMRQY